MFISETGMAISLAALGAFFYMKDRNNGETPENMGWLPLVSMMLYIVTYNLGCASLPWTFMGELCPPQIKGELRWVILQHFWNILWLMDPLLIWRFCIGTGHLNLLGTGIHRHLYVRRFTEASGQSLCILDIWTVLRGRSYFHSNCVAWNKGEELGWDSENFQVIKLQHPL